MDPTPAIPVLRTSWRVLTFTASREELVRLDRRHLAFGLVSTWLVGMGRYWDDPGAHLLQHLGLGSVIYVLVLSPLLFALVWPLLARDWTLVRVLTLVSLVSPPAALYAIPVERFMSMDAARSANAWFLAVVAAWRVALLFFFLFRLAQLRWFQVIVVALLPLAAIVTVLTGLNLQRVVFDLMGGFREPGPHDIAYEILFGLTMLSVMAIGPLLIAYLTLIVWAQVRKRRAAVPASPGTST